MVATNEQIEGARMIATEDVDVIAAIDAKELRGTVGCASPGRAVAYVAAIDLETWKAKRNTNA